MFVFSSFSVDLKVNTCNYKYEIVKASLKTPEQQTVDISVLNKREFDSIKGNSPVKLVDLNDFDLDSNKRVVEVGGKIIDFAPNFDQKAFPIFSSIDDYLKFVHGKMHYDASYFLDHLDVLRANYFMEESAIQEMVLAKRYRIDSTNYPSRETPLQGGYKAYFFDDGSVGYFYNYFPKGNRYMGWWHSSIADFEWFYNNVYELTDLKNKNL